MSTRQNTGKRAEELAVAHLERAGMRIVHRNWRRNEGELDIVADDGGLCVFVEVRSRTGDAKGHPLEMITPAKVRQVIRIARIFMNEEQPKAQGFRFDVVGVHFSEAPDGEPIVTHISDAFDTN